MILAAGRGERMRPLSDACPKPLLEVGGKPLIVWQIEALARAGFRDIVINAAHHAERLVDALGDGAALGVSLRWSLEPEAYETAGGIVTALPLLAPGPFLVVSADIHTDFDYASLLPRAQAMASDAATAARASRDGAHLGAPSDGRFLPRGRHAAARKAAKSSSMATSRSTTRRSSLNFRRARASNFFRCGRNGSRAAR